MKEGFSRSLQQVSGDGKEAAEKEKKGSKLTTEEEAKTGRALFSILLAYCRACTFPMSILVLVLGMFINVFSVSGNFWLAAWSNAEDRSGSENFTGSTACDGVNGTIV